MNMLRKLTAFAIVLCEVTICTSFIYFISLKYYVFSLFTDSIILFNVTIILLIGFYLEDTSDLRFPKKNHYITLLVVAATKFVVGTILFIGGILIIINRNEELTSVSTFPLALLLLNLAVYVIILLPIYFLYYLFKVIDLHKAQN